MKILLSLALIFVFVLANFGQTKPAPTPEEPILLTVGPPTKKGENAEAVKTRNCGIELAIKGEHKLSLAEFNKAIELEPNFADAYNRRGAAYSNLNDNKRAIADFSKAIELQSDFDVAYMNRAMSYMLAKNFKLAVKDYTKLIELQPEMALWYSFRADAYEKLGNKKLAEVDQDLRKKSQ